MHIIKTKIKDLLILKTNIYKDKRGFFKEVFKKKILFHQFQINHFLQQFPGDLKTINEIKLLEV